MGLGVCQGCGLRALSLPLMCGSSGVGHEDKGSYPAREMDSVGLVDYEERGQHGLMPCGVPLYLVFCSSLNLMSSVGEPEIQHQPTKGVHHAMVGTASCFPTQGSMALVDLVDYLVVGASIYSALD